MSCEKLIVSPAGGGGGGGVGSMKSYSQAVSNKSNVPVDKISCSNFFFHWNRFFRFYNRFAKLNFNKTTVFLLTVQRNTFIMK